MNISHFKYELSSIKLESTITIASFSLFLGVVGRLVDLISNHPNKTKLFTPRLYMTDKWSISMMVDNFSKMDHYQSKTLVFSTPVSFAEKSLERQIEWVVDFSPKGVCYFKHYLIVWQVSKICKIWMINCTYYFHF